MLGSPFTDWILLILVWIMIVWIISTHRLRNHREGSQTERNDESWYRLMDGDYVFEH